MIPLDSLTRPAPSFDHPLEMLLACHGKLRRFCRLLGALPQHLADKGADAGAVDAAQSVLRYFDSAGPLHHQDEEDELFPLLRQRDLSAAERLARLTLEHRHLTADWQTLRPLLQQVAAGAAVSLPRTLIARFVGVYQQHMALEESWLIPLAAELFSADELRAAGQRMAARRQDGN
jgi:hemerythrin-like domain-containing protein